MMHCVMQRVTLLFSFTAGSQVQDESFHRAFTTSSWCRTDLDGSTLSKSITACRGECVRAMASNVAVTSAIPNRKWQARCPAETPRRSDLKALPFQLAFRMPPMSHAPARAQHRRSWELHAASTSQSYYWYYDAQPNAKSLSSMLKKSTTIEKLLRKVTWYESLFDQIHLSVCWNSLGQLTKRGAEQRWLKSHPNALKLLVNLTIRAAGDLALEARAVANIAYGAALVGKGVSIGPELYTALGRVAERRAREFKPQELANFVWAFAKLDQFDVQLFKVLAKVAERRIRDFNAQELSNIAWAFATLGHLDSQLFPALARAAEQRIGDFNAQDLANTAWAFAALNQCDTKLFASLARVVEQRIGDFKAQDLATIAWAFATLGQDNAHLFSVLAQAAKPRVRDFNIQSLVKFASAFATLGHLDAQLFKALAEVAEQRASAIDAKDIANIRRWAVESNGA